MKSLRQFWIDLEKRYQALSQRERLLVALAVVIAPLLIGNALFVDPQRAKLKGLEGMIVAEESSAVQLQAEAANLQLQLNTDPDAGRKAELLALNGEREKLDEQMRQFSSALVRPEEMNALLERLLVRQAGLQLVSLKTLPPQGMLRDSTVVKGAEAQASERTFDLYRHGVEIRLEGGFSQLQAYVVQLKSWSGVCCGAH